MRDCDVVTGLWRVHWDGAQRRSYNIRFMQGVFVKGRVNGFGVWHRRPTIAARRRPNSDYDAFTFFQTPFSSFQL